MKAFRTAFILLVSFLLLAANVLRAPMRRALRGQTERVVRSNLTLSIRCAGVLQAKNVQVLRSGFAARVLKKHAEEGDAVKKGQLLLEFDETALLKDLKQSQDQMRDAARDYAKAVKEVRIQQNLFGYGAVPKKNIEDAQAARDKTQTALDSAKQNVADKLKTLGKTKVFSPMDGFVITDFIKKDVAAAMDKELFSVGTLDAFQVEASVDEVDLSKIAIGQDVEIKVDAFPDTALPGKVVSVASKAERTGFAKVPVIVKVLDNKRLSLLPNLSVEATVTTGRLQSVLTVPFRAVFHKDGQDFVWVIGRTGRTLQKRVELGESNDDRVVVRSGLDEGEVVVLPELMEPPIIELKDVSKSYRVGDMLLPVLSHVSLKIDKGEFTAILGPSGSGKSTLLAILGCLDSPTTGEVFLKGRPVAGLGEEELAKSRNREIGFVFQNFHLLPYYDALSNVELPLAYADAANPRARATELLAQVGLKDRMNHLPNQLSGGQRQRVAIARALATRPSLLLADEPTGNLDSKMGDEILSLFRRLHHEGSTILIVTHDTRIASLARRVIRVGDGTIVSDRHSLLGGAS